MEGGREMKNPIYFGNPVAGAREVMEQGGLLGLIDTPDQGNKHPDVAIWIADNGKFSPKRAESGEAWDEQGWWDFLVKNSDKAHKAAFATAPDVVHWVQYPNGKKGPMGDAAATLIESARWYDKIRELGYPVALVAQDGLDPADVPWDKIDAIFIGGSDDYKVGTAPPGRVRALKLDGTPLGIPGSIGVIQEAKRRGKWVHIGRVNSQARYRFARMVGADSVDGTYLKFGPSENLANLMIWLAEEEPQMAQSDYALAG
jgi:hypothetical protein